MYTEYVTQYSSHLNRDMHMMIYGHDGLPFLCFPCQDSMCHNYEEFGMIAEIRNFIDDGRIRLFVVDSVDKESWSKGDWDKARRSLRQEQYYHYISEEAVPFILERTGGRLPIATGMSMGANHAAILFLRRPDGTGRHFRHPAPCVHHREAAWLIGITAATRRRNGRRQGCASGSASRPSS